MKINIVNYAIYTHIKTLKFREWIVKNPITRWVLLILFYPIILPIGELSFWFMKRVTFKMLDKAISESNNNHILQISANLIKNMALRNKWKAKISTKWFRNTMVKKSHKIYNYIYRDKTIVSFHYFNTLIDLYLTYNIIGGDIINTTGDTIITVE